MLWHRVAAIDALDPCAGPKGNGGMAGGIGLRAGQGHRLAAIDAPRPSRWAQGWLWQGGGPSSWAVIRLAGLPLSGADWPISEWTDPAVLGALWPKGARVAFDGQLLAGTGGRAKAGVQSVAKGDAGEQSQQRWHRPPGVEGSGCRRGFPQSVGRHWPIFLNGGVLGFRVHFSPWGARVAFDGYLLAGGMARTEGWEP